MSVVAARDSAFLSAQARLDVVLGWWSIEEGEDGYDALPQTLKEELASADEPGSVWQSWYEPLLFLALEHRYVGVTNEYLQGRLGLLGLEAKVEGDLEHRTPCPCCGYMTLSEEGGCDICRVCFWEDCGVRDLDRRSGPNHCTLRQGRNNFARLGAMSAEFVDKVLPDGPKRYPRFGARDVRWKLAKPPPGPKSIN